MATVSETYNKHGITARVTGKHRSCIVYPSMLDDGCYVRQTSNGSKHGRRYATFRNYQNAIDAAITWADRKYNG